MLRTFLILATLSFLANSASADDPKLVLESPLPFQVVQRNGYLPEEAHEHAEGGPQLGYADVPLSGKVPAATSGSLRFRVSPAGQPAAAGSDWKDVSPTIEAAQFTATIRLPAGWHRLEVEWGGTKSVIEPIGVGEVFLIAGQSYAAGANDELLKVSDLAGRVVAFDTTKNAWRTAHDPQPDVGDGGTLWPALGDLLVPVLRVPVGFVNVAAGGTSSKQWLPGTPLYERLAKAGKTIGKFRAVLWQQGESDVIEKVATAKYVENLRAIRARLADEWSNDVPWLLAKSTLHPTVYNDPAGEARIRRAIGQLWELPGFRPGPDTDILGGDNRGGMGTRRHFTGAGQREAAKLWFASVWNEIHRRPSDSWGSPRIVQFDGQRAMIFGDKPARPAPTVLVFATSLENMARLPIYSQVGRNLAEHGFLTVAIDPPCHGADLKDGEKPELQGWPGRCDGEDRLIGPFVERTRKVLDGLIAGGYSDPQRIAAAGTSRGGFLAFQFAATEPRIRAAAGFAPVTNLLALREFAGQEQNAVVKSLALVNVADKLAGRPVWLSIGNSDERVNTDDAVAFARRVAAAGAKSRTDPQQALPVELIVGASAGHATPPHAHEQAADFIRRHLAK